MLAPQEEQEGAELLNDNVSAHILYSWDALQRRGAGETHRSSASKQVTTERSEYMSILNQLASFQGRRDDIPNQELAIELVAKQDKASIRQIAENLWNKDKNIQSDSGVQET